MVRLVALLVAVLFAVVSLGRDSLGERQAANEPRTKPMTRTRRVMHRRDA